MMNAVSICLLATSLFAAGIWPTGKDNKGGVDEDNLIVKEGHRVVVVEYNPDGGQPMTKVSFSPESDGEEGEQVRRRGPKELICDAYGKCVHKMAEAVGRTKEAVAETARKAEEKVEQVYDKAKHTARKAEEKVEMVYHKAKQTATEASEIGETIRTDVAKNVTGFVRRVRHDLGETAKVAGRMVSAEALNPVSGTFYLLAFCAAYGAGIWVTFVLTHVLAGALPRQQFAVVQSKLFPVYFRWMSVLLAVAIFWFAMSHRGAVFSRQPELLQLYNLSASLLLVLVNALYLEPKATKVMFDKMKLEKEEGREREEVASEEASEPSASERAEQEEVRNRIMGLSGRLKKLNTWSSFLNILSLMSLSWHVYYLGHRLHITF